MANIGGWEIFLVFLVILLIFGASRLPKLARSMGQAGKEFKAGLKEGYKEEGVEGPCPFCQTNIDPDARFCPGCGKSSAEVVAERERRAATSA